MDDEPELQTDAETIEALAKNFAAMSSGFKGAEPTQDDYELAIDIFNRVQQELSD